MISVTREYRRHLPFLHLFFEQLCQKHKTKTKSSPILEYGNRATSAPASHGAEEYLSAAFDSKGRLSEEGGGGGGGGVDF